MGSRSPDRSWWTWFSNWPFTNPKDSCTEIPSSPSPSAPKSLPEEEGKTFSVRRVVQARRPGQSDGEVWVAFALGVSATLLVVGIRRRYFRRFPTGEWVTPNVLAKRRWIRGVVTSVGDADNFRLYHIAGFGPFKSRAPSSSRELKDQTLHIRLAGADAPEGAHFGKPGQASYAEALAWLKQRVEGKLVYCQPIRRDQYGRLVSICRVPKRFLPKYLTPIIGSSLSLELLSAGWGTTYQQAGAEYGLEGKDEYLRVEQEARAKRRGMWASGAAVELPQDYKRRHAQMETPAVATSEPMQSDSPPNERQSRTKRKRFLRRMLGL